MIDAIGERARAAARRLARTTTESKNAALLAMAQPAGGSEADAVLEANGDDVARAEEEGISKALLDRLRLDRFAAGGVWRLGCGPSPPYPTRSVRSPRGGGWPTVST